MSVSLTADKYEVTKVSVSGNEHADGDLKNGFTIATDIVDGKTTLGSIMTVTVTWAVTGLADVKFYFKGCTLTHGTTDVEIIKDSCFASVVQAHPDSTKTEYGQIQAFNYKTFVVQGITTDQQQLTCTIGLCLRGQSCGRLIHENQCPSSVLVYKLN